MPMVVDPKFEHVFVIRISSPIKLYLQDDTTFSTLFLNYMRHITTRIYILYMCHNVHIMMQYD